GVILAIRKGARASGQQRSSGVAASAALRGAVRQLRSSPLVRVGPSTVNGSGDGVFLLQDVCVGTPLTWIDYSAFPTFKKWVNLYQDDTLQWFDNIGCYDGADGSARSATGGVGHLINDAACLEGVSGGNVAAEYRVGEVAQRRGDAVPAGRTEFAAPAADIAVAVRCSDRPPRRPRRRVRPDHRRRGGFA
ncbi:hypothetical protein M885DRAFT_614165, partial [Pelagophyceae sp. CCMP2097]